MKDFKFTPRLAISVAGCLVSYVLSLPVIMGMSDGAARSGVSREVAVLFYSVFALCIIWATWPFLLSILVCVWFFKHGHPILGCVAVVLFFAGCSVLGEQRRGGSWLSGKRAMYDKDGKITGYIDKE